MELQVVERATLISVLFVLACVGWVIVLSSITGLLMLLFDIPYGSAEQFAETLGGTWFGLLSALQLGGFAAIALLAATLVDADLRLGAPGRALGERLRASFPVAPLDARQLTIAAVGGATVWPLPAFLAQELLEILPGPDSNPEILSLLLLDGTALDRAMMIGAIVLSAPLLEELVFRGFLWRVLARGIHWSSVLSLTTALFALSHLDRVQSLAVVPIALFLGLLRYTSRSLLPCMLAHLLNNGIGVLIVTFGPDDEAKMPLWAGLLGAFALVTCSIAAYRTRLRQSAAV